MMIIAVRYIYTETGYERCSQNVKYETVIDEDLHSTDSYDFQGTIIAKTYASVKCVCGQTHRYLITSEHEAISK